MRQWFSCIAMSSMTQRYGSMHTGEQSTNRCIEGQGARETRKREEREQASSRQGTQRSRGRNKKVQTNSEHNAQRTVVNHECMFCCCCMTCIVSAGKRTSCDASEKTVFSNSEQ